MYKDFYSIDGYWKDDKTEFEGLIVYGYDNVPDKEAPYTDDDIFFYGLGESALTDAVENVEDTVHDFVITSFTKIIQ